MWLLKFEKLEITIKIIYKNKQLVTWSFITTSLML